MKMFLSVCRSDACFHGTFNQFYSVIIGIDVVVVVIGQAVVVHEINFDVSMLCHGSTRTLHENIPMSHEYGTWVYRGRHTAA